MEDNKFLVCVRCMTYNHAPYIIDALNGFTMQQTSFPFVCTIVDDASTDGEQEVIRNYLEEHFDLDDLSVVRNEDTYDYHFTFVRHKANHNCYFAVFFLKYNHYSVKKSKLPYLAEWNDDAKYIALCEGDDYWITDDKLQMQADILNSQSDIVYVCTRYRTLEQQTGIISLSPNFYFDQEKHKGESCFTFSRDDAFSKAWFCKTLTCMFRQDCYDYGFLQKFKYRRDIHVVYSLLSKGNGVCCSTVSGVYRKNPFSTFGGKTLSNRIKQNYLVYEELYQQTGDRRIKRNAMSNYIKLFKESGFVLPKNGLQIYSLFVYWPASAIHNFLRKLL